MKISFLFIVLVLFPSSIVSICDIYKCSESSLRDGLCMVRGEEPVGDNEKRNIYYLDTCSSSKYCTFNLNNPDISEYSICRKIEKASLGLTGDKCHMDEECYSKTCNDKKCEAKSVGSSCSDHIECDEESACVWNEEDSKKKCKKLVGKGEKCHYTDECPFNTVCTGDQYTEGTCVDYFSLGIGETSYEPLACATGQIHEYYTSDINSVCAEYTAKDSTCTEGSSKGGYYCTISIKYSTDQSIPAKEENAQCQCKSNGEYGCPAFSDSDSFKNYVEVYKKEVEKVKIKGKQVSSMDRNHWNNKKIKEAYLKYVNHVKLDGADECYEKLIMGSNHLNVYMLSMIALLSLIM